jgi:hypothetical protein
MQYMMVCLYTIVCESTSVLELRITHRISMKFYKVLTLKLSVQLIFSSYRSNLLVHYITWNSDLFTFLKNCLLKQLKHITH